MYSNSDGRVDRLMIGILGVPTVSEWLVVVVQIGSPLLTVYIRAVVPIVVNHHRVWNEQIMSTM